MKKLRTYGVNLLLVVVLFILIQVLVSAGIITPQYQSVLIPICINVMLAVSLNLVCGYLGQLALGHAGFMSVGAYAAAVFTINVTAIHSLPDWVQLILAMLVGAVFAAIAGVIIGIPALRLKGDYLAIMTLGFGEIIRVIFTNLKITNSGRIVSAEKITSFPVAFWSMVIVIVIIYAFIYSRHGRAVISIREDEVASESSGVNITYYKVFAFTLAAAFAGVAGALWSHTFSIAPRDFDFNLSIDILIFVVLGGMGSITGSVIAATILTLLPQVLSGFNDYRMVIYALLLIIMMVFRPGGLLGKYEFSLTRVTQKCKALVMSKRNKKGGAA